MKKSDIKALALLLALGGLLWDLATASEHQQTCPSCLGRDYLAIALDVAHLARFA